MKRKYWLSYSGVGQLKTLSPVHPCINKDERIPYTRHIVHTPSTYQLSEAPTCAKCQRRSADFEMAIFVLLCI